MAYPSTLDSFTTKVANTDLVRAAHINSLQDAVVNIETELGYGATAGTSLAVANTYMKRDANGIAYDNKYGVQLYASGTISIPNNTWTAVPWTGTRYTYGSMWNSGDPTKITCAMTGLGLLNVFVTFPANSTGTRGIAVRDAGVTYLGQRTIPAPVADCSMTLTKAYILSPLDYLEVMVFQNSGGSLNLTIQNFSHPECSFFFI